MLHQFANYLINLQEGSLCAQHCLNALLQGAYFTPVDLSTLAQRLDEEERICMAECGEESEEYQRFLQQASGNMDDSGYFSIQVISSALEVWGLELVPYLSTDSRVQTDPTTMQAFICNHKDHWFTIRRIGDQWFNLNSLLPMPELISNTHLSLILAQLRNDGYSIFVVFGQLPDCDADQVLRMRPVQSINRRVIPVQTVTDEYDQDLQNAIKLSLNDDSDELEKALQFSLCETPPTEQEDDEEAQLRKAIQMSLECKSRTPSTPSSPCDPDEIRNRRLAYLARQQNLES
ncbi:ataxin-3-like isoform X1 [Photinus pyralis]|uniref:ataxin-3-like isoform X1 n=1 Tax=Photinus pyralis TaxID=7054 RepID=UPI0012674C58|nr:ataxin-3-like isoform X1 [Photinus pyralis]